MRIIGLAILTLLLTGCINISTRFQPDDLTVKEELQGSDCVPIILSFDIGTADIEAAKRDAKKVRPEPQQWQKPPVRAAI